MYQTKNLDGNISLLALVINIDIDLLLVSMHLVFLNWSSY